VTRFNGLWRRTQTKYYESMDHLNKFLHEKHLHIIDPSLCSQLRMFYRFAHSRHESGHMHEVLEHISPTLRGKVAWRVRPPPPRFFLAAHVGPVCALTSEYSRIASYSPRNDPRVIVECACGAWVGMGSRGWRMCPVGIARVVRLRM
jgi:hypothetical protein